MSNSTHLPPSSSPLILKFLQLILSIERSSLSTDEKDYARFFQSSGELIRDFFGAERVSAFVYIPDEERFVDGWSSQHSEMKQEHDRANAWASLFIQQPSTLFQRTWTHQEVEDRARQVSSLAQHHAWMIPWIEQQPNEGFMVIEEPHHPLANDAQFAPLLSTLATMVYSIIRRLQTGMMARVSTTAVDEVNYRIAQFSHQIRTPLMGMLNAMQLMADQQVTLSQKEYFDIAWNSAKTMQLMLDRILDIAKLDSHNPQQNVQAFDLETELLVIIKNQLLAAQEKGLMLHLTFDHPLHFKVIGDNVLLHHVLMNLLSNAIKYTNEGSVTLAVNTVKLNRESIRLEFAVKDTGIGIPKAYLSQLFKPYFRVNDLYSQVSSGTGLGLPIVQDILQRINSRLEIETVEGQGSTFSFVLPFKILEDAKLYDFHLLQDKEVCLIHQQPTPTPELVQRLTSLQLKITAISNEVMMASNPSLSIQPTTAYVIVEGSSDWMVEWLSHPPVIVPHSVCMLGYYCCKEVGHHQQIASDYTWLSSTQSRLEWRDILLKSQAQQTSVNSPKLKHVMQPWKVMLIDDNPINLKTLEALLMKAGLKVTIATDSIQGLRQIGIEVYDFILLDIKMPELSGPEVLQRIRLMRHPNATAPVFAATAYAFDKEQKEFLNLGFNEVITKPVDINLLLRLMMRYKEVHFDEVIAPTWGAPTQQETFNEAEFNHHYEGLDSLKNEVMQLFFEQSEGSLRRIQSAITEMNFEKIAFEAHYYKGSCSYLSAPRITWLCTKLIEFAKRKEAEPIPQILAQLIQETTLFNYRVRDYLGHQGPTNERPLRATSPRPSHQP